MESQDILIVSVYFLFFLLIGTVIQLFKSGDLRYKYFLPALTLKLIGGLSFALIYKYYYGYGDTFAYYSNSLKLTEILLTKPGKGLDFLFYFSRDVGSYVAGEMGGINRIINGQNTFLVVKFAAVANLLSFSNFMASTIIFSVLSFSGMWVGYLAICKKFNKPKMIRWAAIAFFFVPSVFFWGSGLMKDSIVIGFLGILIYALMPIGNLRFPGIKRLLLIIVAGYVILVLKAYVVFCLVPALAYWLYLKTRSSIKNIILKAVVAPLFLATLFAGVIFSVSILGDFTDKYRVDQVLETAKIYQDYHSVEEAQAGRGSSYTLPDYGNDILNAVANIPTAINVTLYRPYPWEISSAVVAFAALESLLLFFFSIHLIFRKGLFRIYRFLQQEPFLFFILLFTLLFSYVIGFSSYNFGALVRYKIQCIPLYIFMLFAIKELLPDKKLVRKATGRYRNQAYPQSSA